MAQNNSDRNEAIISLEKKSGEVLGGPCTTASKINIRQELKPGQIELSLNFPIGFVADEEGEPASFSPDIWYRANSLLRLGLVHSQSGTNGFWLGSGTSICLSGDESCPDVFPNTGLRALLTLYRNDLVHVLADSGLFIESFEPSTNTSVRAALLLEIIESNIRFRANPGFHFALTGKEGVQTELLDRINQNEDEFYLPVDVSLMLFRAMSVGFQVGLRGTLTDFIESYTIPVSVSTVALLNEHFALGFSYGFRNLLGPGENSSDLRDIQVYLNIRI